MFLLNFIATMPIITNTIELIIHVILFVIFFISLYSYNLNVQRITRSVPKVTPKVAKNYSSLSPYHVSNSIVRDKYEQLFNINNFSFLINCQPCNDYPSGLLLIVIVTSDPRNHEKRKAIRQTWGQNLDSMKVVFLFGESEDETISHQIRNESIKYGDIVQGNFQEAYRNMTYKHVMGLKWVAHYCPAAKYVLKIDDDVLVNSDELRHYLARDLSPWGARDLIMCQVLDHTEPFRLSSKWKVTVEEYAPQFYPRYCAGWAILYSIDVVIRLLETSESTPYFWIDDVYVTGLCADKIDVPRTSISSLILSLGNSDILMKQGPKGVGRFLIGPFELSPERVVELWGAIHK